MSQKASTMLPPPAFGAAMREQEFILDADVTYLNHGSFGVVPRQVHEAQVALIADMEKNPDLFSGRSMNDYWDQGVAVAAQMLGSDPANLTFIENTTRGISNVLRSVPFVSGDVILYNNLTYGAMKNAIRFMKEITPGVETMELEHTLPIASSDDVVQKYEDALDANPNIKLALIDHIASFSILFPIKRLVDLCKSRGVLVLVDGAHCPGQVHLDLEALAPDFYIGNLYKWSLTPRGCAIQWVAPQHHSMVKPAVISFGINSPYPTPFIPQGARDSTPYAAVPTAADFRNWTGGLETLHAYTEELYRVGMPMLTAAWGTELADIPDDMLTPCMRLVKLPPLKTKVQIEPNTLMTMGDLYDKHKIWCSMMLHNDQLYARISTHMYVDIADFGKLRDAILDMME